MADIKRLNYFNSQFLVDKDFNDEQAYHVEMRRRLNRSLHSWGIADGGLNVTGTIGSKQLSVSSGVAIDKDGREIVLLDSQSVNLTTFSANTDVYVIARYRDFSDPADHYTSGGVDNYTRWTERPVVEPVTAAPATDGSVIILAVVHLDASANISAIDTSVRTAAGSKIDPKSNLQVGSLSVSGNLSIGETSAISFGARTRQMMNLWQTKYGIGIQAGTQYYRTDAHFAWFRGGTHNDAVGNPGAGGVRLMAVNSAGDLILGARTNPGNDPSKSLCRALVDFDSKLYINFANDFNQGTFVDSDLSVKTDLSVGGNVNVTGTISSPKWKITQVFGYESGPLPKSNGAFSSGGGVLLVFASGSGYRTSGGLIGMRIKIDNVERGQAHVYTNEASSHKSFVTNTLMVAGLPAANHTVALEVLDGGTITDGNDRFDLTILELPFQQVGFIPPIVIVPPVILGQ